MSSCRSRRSRKSPFQDPYTCTLSILDETCEVSDFITEQASGPFTQATLSLERLEAAIVDFNRRPEPRITASFIASSRLRSFATKVNSGLRCLAETSPNFSSRNLPPLTVTAIKDIHRYMIRPDTDLLERFDTVQEAFEKLIDVNTSSEDAEANLVIQLGQLRWAFKSLAVAYQVLSSGNVYRSPPLGQLRQSSSPIDQTDTSSDSGPSSPATQESEHEVPDTGSMISARHSILASIARLRCMG